MKTSDLTLSAIVIFIFICLYAFNLLVVGIQTIKDNWPIYRCQPLIMPFASIFGHNTGENFAFCIKNIQHNLMGPLLQPLNFNIGLLGDITGGLASSMNTNRSFTSYFRISIFDTVTNIFSTISNMTVELQKIFINLKDMVGKLIGVMTTTLYVMNGSVMTMQSAWAGPPGELTRALCFHPNTKLTLKDGANVAIKDVPLNSILNNGARVEAVMQISNLDENNAIIEKMYRVKRIVEDVTSEDILVSGSHLIYYPAIKQFVHVKDLPDSMAKCTEINCDVLSCLITSNHTIPIGDWIFHDWEDNNGSASKTSASK